MKYLLILLFILAGGYLVYNYGLHQDQLIVKNNSPTPTAFVSVVPTTETNESIAQAIKQELVKKHGAAAANLSVVVKTVVGKYAKGSANEPVGGGGLWFAVKDNSQWKLIWDGNGIITCDDVKLYPDLPKTFVSQCFDTAKNDLVTR